MMALSLLGDYLLLMIICYRFPRFSHAFYWLNVAVLHVFLRLPIFRVVIKGQNRIPKSDPIVVCGKHNEYTDIPFLGIVVPARRIHFLAKAGLFKFFLFGCWIRSVGSFPVHPGQPDRAALKFASGVLKNGKVVGIMPEGTRRSQESVEELEEGAAVIASRGNAAIVPIGIYYRRFYRWRIYQLVACIGDPIDSSQYSHDKEGRKALTDELQRRLSDAQEQAKNTK